MKKLSIIKIILISTGLLVAGCNSGTSTTASGQNSDIKESGIADENISTQGFSISSDSSGNSYVAGATNVGISGESQQGNVDYFIAKHGNNGALMWTKQVGITGGNTYGQGISVDNYGNSYITGYTDRSISHEIMHGFQNYFIDKHDNNGNLLWTRQVGATGGNTYGMGIKVDSAGNSYIIGKTDVAISGQLKQGRIDYFIAKYDNNGNLIWTRQVGATGGNTFPKDISIDSYGNSYVIGNTNVGISGQQQNGLQDYFVAKYDNNGNLLWARQVGSGGPNVNNPVIATRISVDGSGNVYAAGSTDAGISGQTQQGLRDYFIAKYDSDGNLIATKQVGESGFEFYVGGIGNDNSGNIYITGYADYTNNTTYTVYFTSKYNSDGTLIWDKHADIPVSFNSYIVSGISVDSSGNFYNTGYTNYMTNPQGSVNYFINSYNSDGSIEWQW